MRHNLFLRQKLQEDLLDELGEEEEQSGMDYHRQLSLIGRDVEPASKSMHQILWFSLELYELQILMSGFVLETTLNSLDTGAPSKVLHNDTIVVIKMIYILHHVFLL